MCGKELPLCPGELDQGQRTALGEELCRSASHSNMLPDSEDRWRWRKKSSWRSDQRRKGSPVHMHSSVASGPQPVNDLVTEFACVKRTDAACKVQSFYSFYKLTNIWLLPSVGKGPICIYSWVKWLSCSNDVFTSALALNSSDGNMKPMWKHTSLPLLQLWCFDECRS